MLPNNPFFPGKNLPADKIPVVIAEYFPELRAKWEAHLNASDIQVVGTAQTGEEATWLASQLNPRVVVTAYRLPDLDGPELAQRLIRANPSVGIIIVGYTPNTDDKNRAKEAGVQFVFEDPVPAEKLLEAVRTLAIANQLRPSRLTYATLVHQVYTNLKETQNLEQIITRTVSEAFEKALASHQIVLTRPERVRIYRLVLKKLLNDLLDDSK